MKQEEKRRNNRHKAETANLNQQQNHHLPEAAPLHIRIRQYQSCYAGGGGGSKERSEKPTALAAAGRRRQSQQQRADQNDTQKGQHNILLSPNTPLIPRELQPIC